ncbi:MAG: ABC transporter permease [Atribacterota bacterium]|nr:ABC transporter permease [Atribacterota bacterium]MDD4895332.1 ABC transporter permease [Atribacterota bacterium]MDD5637491.1 ABC transporter permease [Atribacterota bacterium]
MKLGQFILRRLLLGIFVIIGLSILIFTISRVIPGDPARLALGPRAPVEVVEQLRQELYLDKSLPVQYWIWLTNVMKGDFGRSLVTRRSVVVDIREYLPATLELVFFTAIIMVFLAILLGAIAARNKDKWIDSLIRIFAYVGVSIPAFVLAVFFILIFGYAWPILPVLGRLSSQLSIPRVTGFMVLDALIAGKLNIAWDAFKHLILPAFALALGPAFQEARITRSSMVDNMNKDYISAERGYGFSEKIIMFKYLLRPSLIPTVSVMGMDIAATIGNAFLVELIFNWPGISRYGINAMLYKDLNAISGTVLIIGLVFVLTSIIVDIIVSFLDPSIRLRGIREGENGT